ncbi:MAG: ABC transporter permease subunit [Pseudomonadales bacterium]|jgi:phosphate transport system permease protein
MALTVIPKKGRDQRRQGLDRLAARLIPLGGFGVLAAISAIFLYLLWATLPLLREASQTPFGATGAAQSQAPLLTLDSRGDHLIQLDGAGRLSLQTLTAGETVFSEALALGGAPPRRAWPVGESGHLYAVLLETGAVQFFALEFPVRFSSGAAQRTIRLSYPFGKEPLVLPGGISGDRLQSFWEETQLTLAYVSETEGPEGAATLHLLAFDEVELGLPLLPGRHYRYPLPKAPERLARRGQQWLFLDYGDRLEAWFARFADSAEPSATLALSPETPRALLFGGQTWLLGDAKGTLRRTFPVRDGAGQFRFEDARPLALPTAAQTLLAVPGQRRILATLAGGEHRLLEATSGATLLALAADGAQGRFAFNDRGTRIARIAADNTVRAWGIEAHHAELSFHRLWERVWYEGYPAPDFIWQSSGSGADFEAKFSLTPLLFGTLKAALVAMLFATPLALGSAVYTAYFMSPGLRGWIKPSIELIAAMPTVILGFLGALWLAPLIEQHLFGTLITLLALPGLMLGLGWLWGLLPPTLRHRVPPGAHALVLMLPLAAALFALQSLAPALESSLFEQSFRFWLDARWGISFEQRNALIVGLVLGFAITPTIFSIAEDAIVGVPDRLVHGALALGASRWDALKQIVLPAASAGILSALMIGLGRAVGETMIVLMVTGNTPYLSPSLFEGMRTFSANIAIELPEAEVNSTHYRVLFLTALLLFAMTFLANTAAEVVRGRLRKRYGALA